MKSKIDTPEGREIDSRRTGTIEPVFGNIKNAKGLDGFTMRSKAKVNVQWVLYCMVHNIEKILKYGEYDYKLPYHRHKKASRTRVKSGSPINQ